MIRLICTNCQAELQIDDAFAGGVCRCQHCGTIQTVPATADTTGATVSQSAKTKTLYQRKTKTEGLQGSGLDQLADIVASSGLSGSGLTSGRLRKPNKGLEPQTKTIGGFPTSLVIAVASIILVLVLLVIWLALRQGGSTTDKPGTVVNNPGGTSGGTETPAVVKKAPSFLGVPLDSGTVIFVIDRGGGTREYFSALKEAVLQSLATLGTERKFQVIFWGQESTAPVRYPLTGTAYATADNIESTRKQLEEVMAGGATDISAAIKAAFTSDPAAVVVATGKGWDLDDTFAKTVIDARGTIAAKVHTISVGESPASAAFKSVSRQTGGQHKDVSAGELRSLLR